MSDPVLWPRVLALLEAIVSHPEAREVLQRHGIVAAPAADQPVRLAEAVRLAGGGCRVGTLRAALNRDPELRAELRAVKLGPGGLWHVSPSALRRWLESGGPDADPSRGGGSRESSPRRGAGRGLVGALN